LREPGLGKADRLCALDRKKSLKIRRCEMLHHRVVRKILQHLLPAGLCDILGDQDEMQLPFVRPQRIATDQQSFRL